MFGYDTKGVTPSSFGPIPEGPYHLRIVEVEETWTKNQDPMVNITYEVDDKGDFKGRKVWDRVVFLAPERQGAGMALHFLKTIGEPFEGKLEVEPERWIGKIVHALVAIDKIYNPDKPKNVIRGVSFDDKYVPSPSKKTDDEVPF